ncbi:MAG: hypothetical protein ACTSQZ_01345 [Candidatus Thorarchaeota archaeon]
MAEQFLSRLEKIEASIESLGEMLTRMITLLGTVTELKSDLRAVKDEILDGMKSMPQPAASEAPAAGISAEQVTQIVKTEIEALTAFFDNAFGVLKLELQATAAVAPPPVTIATTDTAAIAGAPQSSGSLSHQQGMAVADNLDNILKSLKMGCKAGPVLEIMTEAKAEIMKIVPSDAIMIKIDKWIGVVSAYSKRHELQARDILKLKKELKVDIPSYRPA